jgi:molecular chaperone GrpE
MSEPATPRDPADAPASGAPSALTPEAIEAMLADFRVWLSDLAQAPLEPADQPSETVDLHSLISQFTALRHEVNLQTRAARLQQEQTAHALKEFGEVFQDLKEAREQIAVTQQRSQSEAVEPLLKALIDVADAQRLAYVELQRLQQAVEDILMAHDTLEASVARNKTEQPKLSLLARLFGAGQLLAAHQQALQQLGCSELDRSSANAIRQRIDAVASGLAMGVQRIERALNQAGLETVATVGQAFDPEQMEAVEVTHGSNRPSREVAEEVRRGYRWQGRVFRFAQVRVAK